MSTGVQKMSISLGDAEGVRTRDLRQRSSVLVGDDAVYVGEADGTVSAYDGVDGERLWSIEGRGNVVSLDERGSRLIVGERAEGGVVKSLDKENGETAWSYETSHDVGEATKDHQLYYPYVVDVVADDTVYAVSRRYDRGESRSWSCCVYAFDDAGEILWRYENDASPISASLREDGEKLAVGFNRAGENHDNGLVVLDTETGDLSMTWDPGTEGNRRVGDVSFSGDEIGVASHGDYSGYLLSGSGGEVWRREISEKRDVDGDTVYAYPNHVHASDDSVVFVTGNTYAEDTRKPDSLHPRENSLIAYSSDGEEVWEDDLGGFSQRISYDGGVLGVASAQNLRTRDPDVHGVKLYDTQAESNPVIDHLHTEGVVTAVDVDAESRRFAAVEEPMEYDDEDGLRGEYRLHVGGMDV
ncbi:PQQ-binding-like beta-propeller repeat protein [Halorutilales archaeon Cl-col2-1]